jgi:poly-gamma-glutamate synthesis protein (capsule biosynthesis protein)
MSTETLTLFLGGDLMTGRGIDQILPHPNDPVLYESYVRDAGVYVELAEAANGPIPAPVSFDYIWGDALDLLARIRPDARIVNLETAVTSSDVPWPGKGINYRMHPKNVPALTAAALDCCVLANNHVLDWGHGGLAETLVSLRDAGMIVAGAGRNAVEAAAPAVLEPGGGRRVLVFAAGAPTSGIPAPWAAGRETPGVDLMSDLSDHTLVELGARVAAVKQPGDLAVASLHWGGNWGYELSPGERRFAHALIDHAGMDLVHGHSSHHARGIEVYHGHAIIYGCGDLLNDYEGIEGYEGFRADLPLLYWPRLEPDTGRLVEMQMTPMRIRRMRLERASEQESHWLQATLDRESRRLGAGVERTPDGSLAVRWQSDRE